MTIWQSVVNPAPSKSATAESNCEDIEVIRGLPALIDNPDWEGDQDKVNPQFIIHPTRIAPINAMIDRNLPLVFHKVEIYISLYPSVKFLADDLVCEGLLALTEAVHSLAELETPEDLGNPLGYIGQRIIWAITRLVENEEKQQVPSDYRPHGAVIIEQAAISSSLGKEEWDAKYDWGTINKFASLKGHSVQSLVSPDVTEMIEMKELLSVICQTPEDVIILEMREQGSTDLEIAARLDITRRGVCLQRHELLQRYEALEKTTR